MATGKVNGNGLDLPLELAARKLKMVQISFSEESAEKRRKYLAETLGQIMESVLPDQRMAFLEALEKRFPTLATTATPRPLPAPKPPEPAPSAPPPPETPEKLVDRLLAMSALMDEEERERLRQRLAEGRMLASPSRTSADSSRGMGDGTLPRRMQEAMQHAMRELEISKLDPSRMIKLMLMLVAYVGQTDPMIWNTWRTIAPQTDLRRPCNMQKEMGRYLSGDKEISGVELKANMDIMQKLLASLIAATGQLGSLLARQYLARFQPLEIQAQANREGSNLLVSLESRCWNRYMKMARDLEEDMVEHAVKEVMAQYAESMMKRVS